MLARALVMTSALVLLAAASGRLGLAPDSPALAVPTTISIKPRDAATGEPIRNFTWMINLDNSHDAASTTPPASFSPVVASGDETNASGISLPSTVAPDRGYLVTVLANDGVGRLNEPDYKIGGTHFSLPEDAGEVVVEMAVQPHPLPLSTLRARIFHDNASVNNEWDQITEGGLEGFQITIADAIGEVTTDWYGNPLCTEYKTDPLTGETLFDDDGSPIIKKLGGVCLSGPDGIAIIPNLGPNKYETEAIPPDGSGWIQTSTIEGGFGSDAWLHEGAKGFATEPEAGVFTQVWFGFVKECTFGDTTDTCPTNDVPGTGTVTGTFYTNVLDIAETVFLFGNPIDRPYVALTDIRAHDAQVWTGRGNPDGTITIPNVPAGFYLATIWDRPLDHIIKFYVFRLEEGGTHDIRSNQAFGPGKGLARWFGTIRGTVYKDVNENGVRDPGEPGLAGQDLDTRFKDGSIQYATFVDQNGNYEFPEVFELEHFNISEVGYGRFKNTGAAAYDTDQYGNPINYPWVNDCTDIDGNPVVPCTPGSPEREQTDPADWRTAEHGPINQDLGLAGLLQATYVSAASTMYIDWGKMDFGPNENGGIVGIAFNATTRNELDARLQAAEDYEPGIPGVTVNLYAPKLNASGQPVFDGSAGEILKDHLANVYVTDSWYDLLPTDCIPQASFGRDPSQIQPPDIWARCLELPSLLKQGKPGVFDGGYAFEEDCSNAAATDPFDPNQLLDAEAGECSPVPAGKWVVEVVPPNGYQVVKEEDINVFSGDVFQPQIPPPPCVGPLHTVDVTDNPAEALFDPSDPSNTQGVYNPDFLATTSAQAPNGGSPFEGQRRPLCNERLIDLQNGFNANSDFFIFSLVPAPGRIRGVLLDDLAVELDPANPNYAEKRGLADTPVGIRDFAGNLITMVHSDAYGRFEVLVPSTGTYNCPLPAGPCPGTYFVVGNDPGDVANPDPKFNPNYQTLPLVFQVWPGLTTYADVAIIPNTNFLAAPTHSGGSQFVAAPQCKTPAGTPEIQSISQPYGTVGPGSFTINGAGFGAARSVTLDGTPIPAKSWSETAIEIEMVQLSLVSAGPHQLLVTNDRGVTSQSGITFHVLGAGYDPPQRHVGPGQTYTSLQAALDDAVDGDLVLVHPGTYFDKFIVHTNVKLQGYGPGATVLDGRFLVGETIDHLGFDNKVLALKGERFEPSGQTLVTDLLAVEKPGAVSTTRISGLSGLRVGEVIRIDGEEMFVAGLGEVLDEITGEPTGQFEMHVERAINGTASGDHTAGAVIEVGHGWDGATGGRVEPPFPVHVPGVRIEGVPWGQVLTVLAHDGEFHSGFNAQIDGFKITFGRNERGNGSSPNQGGGVYAHGFARHLEVSNNLITGNFGSRGGGVILGLPTDYHGIEDAQNDSIRIHHNRVLNNGGKVHAGAIAIFNGAEDYEVDHNIVCGNYSAEYGAGISHFGLSPGGRIHDNEIIYNYAFDEGGGIMVAGETTKGVLIGTGLSLGSGAVTIERNLIQGNVSNDDGGGIRLLNPVEGPVRIANNMIVNNLAADHGGGISMDDALDVEIVNNTVAKNVSTSTAEDAPLDDDFVPEPEEPILFPPHPAVVTQPQGAGLTSDIHSAAVMDAIADGKFDCAVVNCTSDFSDPKLLNNIFWKNESFFADGTPASVFDPALQTAGFIELEVVGQVLGDETIRRFKNHHSVCTNFGDHCANEGTNDNREPRFTQEVDTQFEGLSFAADPGFIYVLIRSTEGEPRGDYHLTADSSAIDLGTASLDGVSAPTDDFDGGSRPQGAAYDSGADELGAAAPAVAGGTGGVGGVGGAGGGGAPAAGGAAQPAAGQPEAAQPAPAAPPAAKALKPKILKLKAKVRGHRVVVSVRVANCRPCQAKVHLRIRGLWRTVSMRSGRGILALPAGPAALAEYTGTVRNVPSGRWLYYVSVKDKGTGLKATSVRRKVRVP